MKSSRIKIAAALFTASLFLAGCGETLYELSPEERDAVVSYAAHAVAKFNTHQEDGEIFVLKEILDGGGPEQETEEPDTQEAAQNTEETPEQGTEAQEPDTETGTEDTGSEEAAQNTASMEQALGIEGVSADYTGYDLCASYTKSDVFAVDADPGRQLLVLKIKLGNSTEQDIPIDILSGRPVFHALINETESAAAQTTILPNDLSTYQGNLAAGDTAETVLLFQVPQEIQEISGISLKVRMGENEYTVNL